jgi:hypothetical protein
MTKQVPVDGTCRKKLILVLAWRGGIRKNLGGKDRQEHYEDRMCNY